ncbi:prephenate dehydrogenase/arogenate dehydrogenase family protein [Nocardia sp. NPDC052278]|uniref:prephenate dehydrogenase/arogenate dehydrogenase family protein n=1 Tax=unclassified Nocardia TaxID=2637762 RepID=UPI0036B898D8
MATVLAECQARGLGRFYTDVGSAKAAPLAEAKAIGCDLTSYVGGHPMAGSERSGPHAASAQLFDGRIWALTPLAETCSDAIEAVVEFVGSTGARPVMMAHDEHDRIVARTSHAPHLVAAALAATLADADDPTLRLCGAGLRDATRIAAGDAGLWTDILRANATEIAKVLAEVASDLTTAAAALCVESGELTELLERGNAGRALLTEQGGAR